MRTKSVNSSLRTLQFVVIDTELEHIYCTAFRRDNCSTKSTLQLSALIFQYVNKIKSFLNYKQQDIEFRLCSLFLFISFKSIKHLFVKIYHFVVFNFMINIFWGPQNKKTDQIYCTMYVCKFQPQIFHLLCPLTPAPSPNHIIQNNMCMHYKCYSKPACF